MLIIFWLLVMTASNTISIEVTETIEDIEPPPPPPRPTPVTPAKLNTTVLLPVSTSTNTTKHQTITPSSSSERESSKSEEDSNITASKEQAVVEKPGNVSTFKPSPYFESFFDSLDAAPTQATDYLASSGRKPSSALKSSQNGGFKSFLPHFPHNHFSYKVESPILMKTKTNWRGTGPGFQGSKPTLQVPVRVPAGGLYQSSDPFKEKPSDDGEDEDFGLDFNEMEISKHQMRKQENPWFHLVRLATALIPVGIIISALTPSIITVHPGPEQIPSRVYRRSTTGLVPSISERCRRRLLCELQQQSHYARTENSLTNKNCRRIRCEDPEALSRSLQWLLNYHKTISEDNR